LCRLEKPEQVGERLSSLEKPEKVREKLIRLLEKG
jgi:hypothetical protein